MCGFKQNWSNYSFKTIWVKDAHRQNACYKI